MSIASASNPSPAPAPAPAPAPPVLSVQWSSNGESRISDSDRHAIASAVEDASAQGVSFRQVFPIHGAHGALNLDMNGTTIWLFTQGTSFIAGDIIPKADVRVAAMTTKSVDISNLSPQFQSAILTLLNRG